jgi:hypothetical protein
MLLQPLWIIGSLPFVVLGTLHLLYTFFTDKFSSRNAQVIADMKTSHPNLTKQTTLWKAWIGFNASHSLGAIFIGVVNLYLGVFQFEWMQTNLFLPTFTLINAGFYLWLAKKYWFKIPFMGLLIAFTFYLVAFILILAS